MATVYLLDLSGTAQRCRGAAPLSWWCAAELAQWPSAVAVRDAWSAAASAVSDTAGSPPPSHDARYLSESASACAARRLGYAPLGDSEPAADPTPTHSASASGVPPSLSPAYLLIPFPTAVEISNKYFSTSLRVVTGHAPRPTHTPASALLESGVAALFSTAARNGTAAGDEAHSYGGVFVAEVHQDPADVPWHVFPRGSGCHFRVVMVFLDASGTYEGEEKEEGNGDGGDAAGRHQRQPDGQPQASSLPPVSATQSPHEGLKEHWRHYAVENNYECIFHRPLHGGSYAAAESLEVVSSAAGTRGLLSAPLRGSNRLYQLLCNTLWPASARTNSTTAAAVAQPDPHAALPPTQHEAQEGKNGVPQQLPGNGMLIVSNDAHVLRRLFPPVESSPRMARERRQLRFFTELVEVPEPNDASRQRSRPPPFPSARTSDAHARGFGNVACAGDGSTGAAAAGAACALVLANKYYAAVVRPRVLQTAFLSPAMQDLLERYWEQHLSASAAAPPCRLCPEAPALVVWPPSAAEVAGAAPTAAVGDPRSAYPPLETVLDVLRRHGCADVVVVVVADTSRVGQRASSLTSYEKQVCAERHVEVVVLAAPPHPVPRARGHAGEMDVPVPVLCDEDDVSATRGLDRLHEILHCVEWTHTYTQSSTVADTTAGQHDEEKKMKNPENRCLLLACGCDAFQEEAWLGTVTRVLQRRLSIRENERNEVGDHVLAAAAATMPSIAATAVPNGQHTRSTAGGGHRSLPMTLHLSNAYFSADVRLCFHGGLHTYYHAAALPADWTARYDGFVLVTSLAVLREAACWATGGAVAAPPPHGHFVPTLLQLARSANEWWTATLTQDAAVPAHELVDTPLVVLYVADVCATSLAETTEAEESLRSILLHAQAASDGEADAATVPLELVFCSAADAKWSSSPPRLDDGSAPAVEKKQTAEVEGAERIAEAVAQHLWPHRSCQDSRATAPSSAEAVKEKGNCSMERGSDVEPRQAATVGDGGAASAAAMPLEAAVSETATAPLLNTHDSPAWVPPAVGCALPPGYLIDPETLRSVLVPAVVGIATREWYKKHPPQNTNGSRKPFKNRRPTVEEENALMVWMEKMKSHGHRLGETQRKEQAALLTLVLENLL